MDIPTGILFGIISMIAWGTADFLVAKTVRKTSVFKTVLFSQAIGVILYSIIFSLFFRLPILSYNTILIILISGFLGTVSYLAFYKGLKTGKVSIITPIASMWVVITVILSIIFLNETPTSHQSIGVILTITGAVLSTFKLHNLLKLNLKNTSKGIGYASIAMFSWGIYFILIDMLVSELNWFLPLFFIKTTTTLYLLSYSIASKKDISYPKNTMPTIIVIAILEATAFLSFGISITKEYTAIIAPIIASSPMVTIILARILFKETLETNQKIGIASILTGIILLSL